MITVKNNIIIDNDKSYKCSLGKNGVTQNKLEGDGCTPAGKFRIKQVFYRSDRINLSNINFKKQIIKNNFGWCDDPKRDEYNKLVKLPFYGSAESMYRNDEVYDIICEINYNDNPVIKNKGSAVFIHVAKPDYSATRGCIALCKEDLVCLLKRIDAKTEIYIID